MAIEFVGFIPTPNEKYLGIASVKIDNKYIFRYKITPSKEGNGFFSTEASYKIDSTGNSREDYVEAFLLDSNFEIQEIRKLIQNHVKYALAKPTQIQANGSLHDQNQWSQTSTRVDHANSTNQAQSTPAHFEDSNIPF